MSEKLCHRSLSILETLVPPDHPFLGTALNNLGQIYRFEQRYPDAEMAYLRAIGIWEQSVGEAHPDLARCLLNYAALLRKVHRKKEAGEVEARAKRVLAAQGGNYSAAALVDWHELQRR